MNYDLPPKWENIMISLPESGMGYQLVRVTLSDRTQLDGMVLYSITLVLDKKISVSDIIDIELR
jgi:hypothetical protein